MKKIEAILKPFKLDAVKAGLHEVGVTGMTICEIRGFGAPDGHVAVAHGAGIDFLPQVKIEVVVDDQLAAAAIEAIQRAAQTERYADGKIFIMPIDEAVRIRTGETGDAAV